MLRRAIQKSSFRRLRLPSALVVAASRRAVHHSAKPVAAAAVARAPVRVACRPVSVRVPSRSLAVSTCSIHSKEMDFLKFKLMRQDFKDAKTAWTPAMGSFYALKFGGIDGKEMDFATYKGHVTVVMNVACFCGYTAGSYPALQKIYDKYKARGFTAIGFPCNQFGAQEPGTDKEIAETAKTMNVTFPLVTKSDVNGPHTNVVYQFLKKCFPGDVLWNFATKWVINRAGVPVRRFEKESWEEIDAYVGKLLDEPVPGAPAAAAAPAAGAGAAAPAAAAPAAGAGTDAAK